MEKADAFGLRVFLQNQIQTPLIEYMHEELKKGDEVTLFVAWAGARKESGKIDWVFLVNEFEKE